MDLLCVFSVLCLLCLCARLFICALWSPAGKELNSWLSLTSAMKMLRFKVHFIMLFWHIVVSCVWFSHISFDKSILHIKYNIIEVGSNSKLWGLFWSFPNTG